MKTSSRRTWPRWLAAVVALVVACVGLTTACGTGSSSNQARRCVAAPAAGPGEDLDLAGFAASSHPRARTRTVRSAPRQHSGGSTPRPTTRPTRRTVTSAPTQHSGGGFRSTPATRRPSIPAATASAAPVVRPWVDTHYSGRTYGQSVWNAMHQRSHLPTRSQLGRRGYMNPYTHARYGYHSPSYYRSYRNNMSYGWDPYNPYNPYNWGWYNPYSPYYGYVYPYGQAVYGAC